MWCLFKKKKGSKISRLNDNEPQVGLVTSTHPGATDEEWGTRRLGQRPGTLLSYSLPHALQENSDPQHLSTGPPHH